MRNKQLYLPVTSTLTELSGLELKQNTGSLSGFVESSIHTKSRSRQNSQGISSQASGNSVSFSLVGFFFYLFLLLLFKWYLTEKLRPVRCLVFFWLSDCIIKQEMLSAVSLEDLERSIDNC